MGRSRLPCAGIIDPGVAADNCSRPVLALEFGIVGEGVMRHGGVRAEGCQLHVADVATPLATMPEDAPARVGFHPSSRPRREMLVFFGQ